MQDGEGGGLEASPPRSCTRHRQSRPVLGPSQLREAAGASAGGGEEGALAQRVRVRVRVTQADKREADAKS